jgi:hypothetical protein
LAHQWLIVDGSVCSWLIDCGWWLLWETMSIGDDVTTTKNAEPMQMEICGSARDHVRAGMLNLYKISTTIRKWQELMLT